MTVALAIAAFGLLALFGLLLGLRFLDARAWRRSLIALRLHPPARLTADNVSAWLGSLSALTHASWWWLTPQPPLVIEITATAQGIVHHVLLPEPMRAAVLGSVRAHLSGARIEDVPGYLGARPRPVMAAEWRLTNRQRALGSERAEVTATGLLASLQPLGSHEQICVQWILTGAGTPSPVQIGSKTSSPSWWRGRGPADTDELRARRLKMREGPLLHAVGRLGVVAGSKPRAYALFGPTWGTLRQLNAPGAEFVRRLLPERVAANRLMRLSLPLTTWPVVLNAREAVGVVGLPVNEQALPGLSYQQARQVPPPHGLSTSGVTVAVSNYPGLERPLTLSRTDRLRHLYVVGPVGVGKSTLLANLAVQDMAAGDGLALIDPKGDLAAEVLERVPAHRRNDVIVADLSDLSCPVGLNVLAISHDEHGRELAADFVLSVMHSLWAQFWGPRTDDVLRASLLTLTHTHAADGSAFTLVEVPELLTNLPFRRFVTEQPTVPAPLRQFWAWFENVSDPERLVTVGPVLNKLRQFTTRTALRLSLGQTKGLDLASVIRQRRIVLVTLARGAIGAEAAHLFGSLLVAGLWQATLARAALPQEQRRPFWLYLDEFHQVARLNIQFTDLLAEARGLGVGVVMANQYVSQLSPDMRAAVLGTVRSQVVFQVEHDDAKLLAPRFAPTLKAADLSGLAAHEVALRLCSGNQVLPAMTGITLPLPKVSGDPNEVRQASRQRWGMNRADIEAAITARLGSANQAATVGRRHRGVRS